MQATKFKSALSIVMLAVFSTFLSISFQSCTTEGPVDEPSGQDGLNSPVVGKWTVSNQNAGYGSFEFTVDKKYIISQRVSTPPSAGLASVRSASETVYIVIIFGDIASLSNSGNEYTLDLSEFGVITLHIDPAQGTATVTVKGETCTAAKEKEMTASATLDLLCHTWNNYEMDDDDDDDEGLITFTKSGTVLIDYIDEEPLQGTFKLLSSNKIQITVTVPVYEKTVSTEEGESYEYEYEYEETQDYTIEKLTDSEFIFSYIGDDPYITEEYGRKVEIRLTR
jgi:hypothetical protein